MNETRWHRRIQAAGLVIAMSAAAVTTLATVVVPASAAVATSTHVCPVDPAPSTVSCTALRRSDGVHSVGKAGRTASALSDGIVPNAFTPADLDSAYNLTSALGNGAAQTVYIIDAFGDPSLESDLGVYRAQFGLPDCTIANGCFRIVNQRGTTTSLPNPNPMSGWGGEQALDTEMVSASCPLCRITMVEADTATNANFEAAISTATDLLGGQIVLMTWGAPPDSNTEAYDAAGHWRSDVAYVAASGDVGPAVNWPASDPTVVAVGGTTLTRVSSGWSESAWSDTSAGCDPRALKPASQATNAEFDFCTGRADADLSADADPNSGVDVYSTDSRGWAVFGGAGVASSLVAGMYGLATPATGAVRPENELYQRQSADAFRDVISGSTGTCVPARLCTAQAGWDGPTGLGSPNGIAALAPSKLMLSPVAARASAIGDAVHLTVTASDSSEPQPDVTFAASGLPPGVEIDDNGVVSGSPTTGGVYTAVVTADDGTLTDSVDFTWTVSQIALVATVTATQVYGANTTTYQARVPQGGVTVSNASCSTINGGHLIATDLPVGTYAMDSSSCHGGVTSEPGQFAVTSYVGSTLTVTPAPLTITAASVTQVHDGAAPTVAGTYAGFVPGQSSVLLAVPARCTLVADSSLPVGTYPGATACSGAIAPNYAITYVDGQLTVTPTPVTVTVTGSLVGSSAVFQGTASTSGVGLGSVRCTTVSVGRLISNGLPAGSYTIDGSSCTGTSPLDPSYSTAHVTGGSFVVRAFGIGKESLPIAQIGTAYSGKLVAAGGRAPYLYLVSSGTLPPGLHLSLLGAITGTPTTAGTFTATTSILDASLQSLSTTAPVTIVVAPMTVTTTTLPVGAVARTYSAQVLTNAGLRPLKFKLTSGVLPTGLTLSSAGAITGVPRSPSSTRVTITVTDSSHPAVTANRVLSIVVPAIQIDASSIVEGLVGASYSATLVASGGPPALPWNTTSGTLPPGLTLSSTGTISGTPSAAGNYPVTVTVGAGSRSPASASLVIIIDPMSIRTVTLPAATFARSYSAQLTASGGAMPLTWTLLAGELPPGVSLAPNGAVSGQPTERGTFSMFLAVTDASHPATTAQRVFSITVRPSIEGSP